MSISAVGITAEYNPFHNGHLWQLKTLRQKIGDLPVVVCMSGYFVQRGEAALCGPHQRAEAAIRNGADLVLLLPSWYSLRSADYFAAGSVKTLAATGLVTTLVCSAEHAAPETLADTAAWSLAPVTEQQVRTLLQQGLSYAAAWERAAMQNRKDANWFSGANNLLAFAYQKAILQNRFDLRMYLLPRQGSNYNEDKIFPPYASASAIRTALRNSREPDSLHEVLPEETISLLIRENLNYRLEFSQQQHILTTLFAYYLSQNDSRYLYDHSSAGRDLCDRFCNAKSELQQGYAAFCRCVANKRDPLPAVRRLSLQLLLQQPRTFWTTMQEPSFLRVLAFNDRGRNLLKEMKQTASLPIITKTGTEEQYKNTDLYPLLRLDAAAADLFQLLQGNIGCYGTGFTASPVYVKEPPIK